MEKKGAVPYIYYILAIFLSFNSFSSEIVNKIPLKIMKQLKVGKIYTSSKVKSYMSKKKAKQSFDFIQYALHRKSCSIALSKISQYENYKNHIGFVKAVNYNSKTKQLYMNIDSILLPRPFILLFKIDRIISPGTYPFVFSGGILPGLKGQVQVSKLHKRCLFKINATWKGKDSGFSDLLFEMFSSTLAKLALNRIFQISQTF